MKTEVKYNAEALSIEEALKRGLCLPFALLRYMSYVHLGVTPEKVELDELLEARFFGKDEEIRIWNGGQNAVSLKDSCEASFIREIYAVANNRFGKFITVHHYLSVDQDGQTYISNTRLAKWEGGSGNG